MLSIIYMIVISDSLLQYQCCYYSYPCLFIVSLFPIFIIIFIAINIAVNFVAAKAMVLLIFDIIACFIVDGIV